uniref:Uncharacterized protein n=1 Tax=Lepeophtheirus salmonis TaxID=72036 RepID=A0A0K2TG73_LEPSM
MKEKFQNGAEKIKKTMLYQLYTRIFLPCIQFIIEILHDSTIEALKYYRNSNGYPQYLIAQEKVGVRKYHSS